VGLSPADQTSPALAAHAGALFDTELNDEPVTELRIHGVSGSNGPTMLELPTALQVAGDTITGFYRRWNPDGGGRPSVGWKLEAYSWGGLTERPLASASWLVLAPFMIYNLAHFMLPEEPEKELGQPEPESEPQLEAELKPGWRHQIARAVQRLLALAAPPSVRHRGGDGNGEHGCLAGRRPSRRAASMDGLVRPSPPGLAGGHRITVGRCRGSPAVGDQCRDGQPVRGATATNTPNRKATFS
jgi:hypothetical protein